MAFLAAWQRAEGGHTKNKARFNWLNTTSGKQYPSINSVGVRAFPDYKTGIKQTVATLQSGRYRNIEAGLRLGNPVDTALLPAVSGDLQVWVSGRRSGNPTYAKNIFLGTAQRVPGGSGLGSRALHEGWDVISDPTSVMFPGLGTGAVIAEKIGVDKIPVIGGALGTAGDIVSAPADAAKAVVGGFQWIFGNWDRIFLVAGGFIVLLIGLIMLARSMASRPDRITVGLAGKAANRIQYGPAGERVPATR